MKKGYSIYKSTGFIIGHLLTFSIAIAQQASVNAVLNKEHLLIGEQVKLDVEYKIPVSTSISGWINLPDTFNHLEVINRSSLDSSLEGGVKTYHQSFTITGFDSGVWVIPPVSLVANKQKISSPSLSLAVIPVQLSDSTYHDIRDIIEVPVEETHRWYWITGALSIVLLGILIWLWLRSRKHIPVALKQVEVKGSALEEALEQLLQLKKEGHTGRGEWKRYYSSLTGIFKNYIERKYRLGILQKTTDEILLVLQERLSKEMAGELTGTLRVADAVKFAKYQPDVNRAESDFVTIEKTIMRIDSLT
ncbi:MAG: hypothetical protein JST63_04405 [Bacteroidetes bacterium]|nr:hypothetical protein [Bacteroidota bacterium]